MASVPLLPANLGRLLTPDQIVLWLPGVIFGLTLFIGLRRSVHALALPAILLA
jgi:hypothetical protein